MIFDLIAVVRFILSDTQSALRFSQHPTIVQYNHFRKQKQKIEHIKIIFKLTFVFISFLFFLVLSCNKNNPFKRIIFLFFLRRFASHSLSRTQLNAILFHRDVYSCCFTFFSFLIPSIGTENENYNKIIVVCIIFHQLPIYCVHTHTLIHIRMWLVVVGMM